MKNIFDKVTRDQLIRRVEAINLNATPLWGKMSLYQMLKHCTLVDEMYLGKKRYPRAFIGRIFGKMALKSMLKDDGPVDKNMPTLPFARMKDENGDVAEQKRLWIAMINHYGNVTDTVYEHSFFGTLSKEQTGQLAYKHIDHHLRQFNG